MKKYLLGLCLSVAVSFLASGGAHAAYDAENPYEGMLLGDVGGYRSQLSAKGVDLTLEYKADMFSVLDGGLKTGQNYQDNLDMIVDFDNEKLLGISGNTSRIWFVNNYGGQANGKRVGSVEGIDNIETGTNAFKLYELWDQQNFFDDKVSVLLGLHDLNSEFDVTDISGNFIKPTMQLGQAFAQSGANGPDVFPNTGLAARVKVAPTSGTYIMGAVFEGIPGDPDRQRGTHIDLDGNEGALMILEAGLEPGQDDASPNKIGLGVWRYTKKTDDLINVDANGNPEQKHQQGVYFLSSRQLFVDEKAGRDFNAFFRAGIADGNTAQIDWDFETGIVGNGWVPGRPKGEIGFGYTQAHNSDKYKDLVGTADNSEHGLELYYRDTIINGVTIQPDLQYVINPGTDKVTDNATIVGVRFDINF